MSNRSQHLEPSITRKGRGFRLKGGEANTNLLVVVPLSGEADGGFLVLDREVTGGSGLFVDDKVLSRKDDVQ